MNDLAEFLLARIAEDEGRVDAIPDWHSTDSARGEGWGNRGQECPLCGRYMFDGTEVVTEDAWWQHMEDIHCRTRVLAECEAKRRIVGLHHNILHPPVCAECSYDGDEETRWVDAPCPTLRALALTYADHPDYRQAWRP